MPDEVGFDNPQPKDSSLKQTAIEWAKDARNRYAREEKAYPSEDVRNSNSQIVELVFSEVRELDDPKRVRDVQDPALQGKYADALALLGWESVMKDRVENLEPEVAENIDPEVAAEATRVGQQSDKLFLAACDKLFPNLRAQIATRTAATNLRNVSSLLTAEEIADMGESARSTANVVDELDSTKKRVALQYLTDRLADRMRDAISGGSQETFPRLTVVPEPQRNTMVNAAKAMYTLKLATPRV